MLHVDVNVPAVNKNYEFSLNENIKIKSVIEEIAFVISQHEGRSWAEDTDRLELCNISNGHLLPKGKTLYDCKVQAGNKLMLL